MGDSSGWRRFGWVHQLAVDVDLDPRGFLHEENARRESRRQRACGRELGGDQGSARCTRRGRRLRRVGVVRLSSVDRGRTMDRGGRNTGSDRNDAHWTSLDHSNGGRRRSLRTAVARARGRCQECGKTGALKTTLADKTGDDPHSIRDAMADKAIQKALRSTGQASVRLWITCGDPPPKVCAR
jgi:hypothetical protein